MGITEARSEQFFFNDFVTEVLYNSESLTEEELCRNMLKRVAFVNVEMTRTDTVVLTREIYAGISSFTVAGGIVSLYKGVSFMTLLEIAFWIIKIICQLPSWLL